MPQTVKPGRVQVVEDTPLRLKFARPHGILKNITILPAAVREKENAPLHPVTLELGETPDHISAHRKGLRMALEVLVKGIQIHAAHLELQACGAAAPRHGAPGVMGQIGLAGRVDHRFGRHRLAAGFALDEGAGDGSLLQDRPGRESVSEYLDARLLQHLDKQHLQLLRVNHNARHLAAGPLLARAAAFD